MSGKPSNQEIARILDEIASLLSLGRENAYKARAYAQAARNVSALAVDAADLQASGRLREIPGVGASIAAKIDELVRTGHLGYLDELRRDVAPAAASLLDVPGIGPAKARELYDRLGIKSVADLSRAIDSGELATLPGFGERTIAALRREVGRIGERNRRHLLSEALPAAETVLRALQTHPAVLQIDLGGSLRRMRETIGDVDLLAASDRPEEVMDAFTTLPFVQEVLQRGPTKSAVLVSQGYQIDLRVVPPEDYGSALQHWTGAREHNIALRDIAIARGLRLSEYGLFEVATGRKVAGASEEEIYQALGLAWMPPEIRENRGEIEAAAVGRLPHLVELSDLRGDTHFHTDWSDGTASLEAMATAFRDQGLSYACLTDHSQGLAVASGLSIERLREQRRLVDEVNRKLAPFRVLHGAEVDVKGDGTLDYPDEILAWLDFVGVSVHSRFKMPEAEMTERIVRALRNPHVDVLCHPTGRLLERRAGYAVDLERVIRVAVAEGVALEIDGQPGRLDLDDIWARRAAQAGATLVIGSDAHAPDQVAHLRYGLSVARRGWLQPKDLLNTLSLDAFLARRRMPREERRAA